MPAEPAIQPFRIDIPQADLDDLKARMLRLGYRRYGAQYYSPGL